jgi:hypothetical protein
MSLSYICKKCNFNTDNLSDLKRHINKKNPCGKSLEAMVYSDDQILVLTLLPYVNEIHILNEINLDHLNDSNLLYKNKKRVINILDDIDKNKKKCCDICNESFSKVMDLKKHILLSCFHKNIEKIENNIHNNQSIIQSSYNNINNITNSNSNNNNNNSINIILDVNKLSSFDEEWDISKIDTYKKERLMSSQIMYTKLLEEILKNEINLNVIIDKENKSGMVYKNNIEKYIKMKSKDIVSNTMEKLNKHLLDINRADKESFPESIVFSRRMIEKKYIDYMNKTDIQEIVENLICNIYETKKIEAVNISKNFVNNNPYKDIKY